MEWARLGYEDLLLRFKFEAQNHSKGLDCLLTSDSQPLAVGDPQKRTKYNWATHKVLKIDICDPKVSCRGPQVEKHCLLQIDASFLT